MLIEPGVYREAVKVAANGEPDRPILIIGVGKTRPVFDADGLSVTGVGSIPRAIFQIEGSHIVIDNLEFKNARNGDNGAGIRLNQSESVAIRNCYIHHCDMGIQGGDRKTALIEDCEVAFNGTPEYNGYSHNFYMLGNGVVVRRCYIHDSLYGQNYKSRAHYNELWYNWIVDSNEGEVGPVDGKGDTDRPYSNTVLIGNVIVSKPDRTGNKAKYVLFGSESGGSHDGTLFAFFNVFVAGNPKVKFIQLADPQSHAVVENNIFFGSDLIYERWNETSLLQGRDNWVGVGATVPADLESNVIGTDPGFYDAENRDFRLKPESPLWKVSQKTVRYIDGEGVERAVNIDLKKLHENWRNQPLSSTAIGGLMK